MGYGDDLLITKFAAEVKEKHPDRQIVIGKANKKEAYHSIIFDNNPNISDCRNLNKSKPIHIIDYHPGNRPYIDYNRSNKYNYVWNDNFKPVPGEIYFSKEEITQAEKIYQDALNFWKNKNIKKYKKIIFIETSSTKIDSKQFALKHRNLSWGIKNWINLINNIKNDYLIIHSNHEKTEPIKDIYSPITLDFRLACALMSKCDLYVGAHGGFAHVAAALKKNAIIYFGGWATPKVLGYDIHKNIYFENPESPCGMYGKECLHCEEARKAITPEIIEKAVRSF